MALIDMKRTKKETRDSQPKAVPAKEEYPWGLQITLETEELKRLGVTAGNFKPKESIPLSCTAKVTGVSASANEEGKNNESVSLQIIKLDIGERKTNIVSQYQQEKNKMGGVLD